MYQKVSLKFNSVEELDEIEREFSSIKEPP